MIWEYRLQFFAEGEDKTEEPTSKKLSDARDKGQVAKSREVASCLCLMLMFLIIKFWAGHMGTQFLEVITYVYQDIDASLFFWQGNMPVLDMWRLFRFMMTRIIVIILPVVLLGVLISFLSDLVQVRWHPTMKTLEPKLSKLNPINGFKKIFSMNSVVEFLKSLVKIGLIFGMSYSFLKDVYPVLFSFYDRPLMQSIALVGDLISDLGIRISAVFMVVAAADFAYQKWKFHKDMKMTKQEVKDEYKNAEGDPQIKGRIRQKMQEASRRRMMQSIPKADVVITNPTHYAVAIRYDPSEMEAPYVLAKGEGYLAQKIKEVARENQIELVENKPLARMLYHNVEIGEMVPPELYQAVAEVLAFVYSIQGRV